MTNRFLSARGAAFTLGSVLLLCGLPARAETRVFKFASGDSKVQFVSDAPLEKITGATSRVSGELNLDTGAVAKASGIVRVPVASINTNNELRDEHLRGDGWLDAARFPNVEFMLTGVSGLSTLPVDQPATATVRGKLSVHGVTREIDTSAKVRLTESADKQTLRIQGSLRVNLRQHNVSVPSMVQLKVAAVIQVNVDLYAHGALPAAPKSSEVAAAEPSAGTPAPVVPARPSKSPRARSEPSETKPSADESAQPKLSEAVVAPSAPAAPEALPTPSSEKPAEPAPREATPEEPSTPAAKPADGGCSSVPGHTEAPLAVLALLFGYAWLANRRARRS